MTNDITDPTAGIGEAWERGVADPHTKFLTVFARGIAARPDVYSDDLVNSARAVLANVDAPAPTLAEELRCLIRRLERTTDPDRLLDLAADFFSVADYAEQMERDLADARAEVERLNREQDRLQAQVQGLTRRDGDRNSEVRMLTEELDEARAEVERLAAVNEELRRTDNYKEFRDKFLPVQKGAESSAESIDPADVPAGEAWIVEVNGKRGTALKDGGGLAPWSVVINGVFTSRCDEFITLVARLVPEPRTVRYEPKEK